MSGEEMQRRMSETAIRRCVDVSIGIKINKSYEG
jgi:hypothetical protein